MSELFARLKHFNDTAPSSVSSNGLEVTVGGLGTRIRITNQDNFANLLISFDSGQTFYPIGPGQEFIEQARFHSFFVKGDGETVDFNSIVAVL